MIEGQELIHVWQDDEQNRFSNDLSDSLASGLFEDLGFRKHQIYVVRDSNHFPRLSLCFIKTQVETQAATDNRFEPDSVERFRQFGQLLN